MDQDTQQATIQPAPQLQQDPGKTLAIIGIVLAFFFSIAGLIVSIIASKKSKAAGFNGQLAKIGIIINGVLIAISIVVCGLLLSLTLSSWNDFHQKAQETQKRAELEKQKVDAARKQAEQE